MARHPSLPHPGPPEAVARSVLLEHPVSEDPPNPSAKEHTEQTDPSDEIRDLLRRQIRITTQREAPIQPVADQRRQHVRKSIPARSEFTHAKDEWVQCM